MIDIKAPMRSRLTGRALRLATCWIVVRKDGGVIRVTDHNSELTTFQGINLVTFSAVAGFSSSARERESNFKDRNAELVGFVNSNFITEEDLRGGRYDGATVYELLVDWHAPWAGIMSTTVYTIEEVTFTGEQWQAQVIGMTSRITKARGSVYSRLCRFDLFSAFGTTDIGCHLDPAGFTFSGSVSVVSTQRRSFKTSLTEADRYFSRGIMTFTSGLNNGIATEVQTYKNTDGKVVLCLDTPYDVAVSDTFTISAGCDKIITTCGVKFDNVPNFGGQPYIPGTDRMLTIPVAK